MMGYIEHEVGDEKRKQIWWYRFDYRDDRLYLQAYGVVERPDGRYNWRSVEGWGHRESKLKREDVPVPDEVKAAVLEKFRAMITIEE
jgi:hypothetical protein